MKSISDPKTSTAYRLCIATLSLCSFAVWGVPVAAYADTNSYLACLSQMHYGKPMDQEAASGFAAVGREASDALNKGMGPGWVGKMIASEYGLSDQLAAEIVMCAMRNNP